MYEAFDWVKYIVEKELVDVFATEVHDTKTSKAVDDKFCLIRHNTDSEACHSPMSATAARAPRT